jgi:hypothetical protein
MSSYTDTDVEGGDHDHLYNEVVSSYSWSGCSVHVKDRKSKGPKAILDDVEGLANAGTSFIIYPRFRTQNAEVFA